MTRGVETASQFIESRLKPTGKHLSATPLILPLHRFEFFLNIEGHFVISAIPDRYFFDFHFGV
jgi:hypothetical protein